MSKQENAILSEEVKKKPRSGSKQHLETLRSQLPEILDWQEKIKAAKGKEATALRKSFKDKFDLTFNTELMEKLNPGQTGVEKNIENLPAFVEVKTAELNQEVSEQKQTEVVAALGLENAPEFVNQSAVIDEKREQIIVNTGDEAEKVLQAVSVSAISPDANVDNLEEGFLSQKDAVLNQLKEDEREYMRQADAMEKEELADKMDDIEENKEVFGSYKAELFKPIEMGKLEDEPMADDLEEQILSQRETTLNHLKEDEKLEMKSATEAHKADLAEKMDDAEADKEVYGSYQPEIKASEEKNADGPTTELNTETEPTVVDASAQEGGLDKPASEPDKPLSEPDKPENAPDKPKFNEDVLDIFASLNISEKDLQTIPGFEMLNGVSQLLVAESMKSLALENAQKSVRSQQDQALQGKGFFGKIGAGIANAFRLGKQEKIAILRQERGGLNRHGQDLKRLSEWAMRFDLQERSDANGEMKINFLADLNPELLNPDQEKLLSEFNEAGNRLSGMPKHWQKSLETLSKKSPEYKQAKEYFHAQSHYDLMRLRLGNVLTNQIGVNEFFAQSYLNSADSKVNMLQLMTANPELEKEWAQLAKGKSMLGRTLAKENLKFLAGGYLGRSILTAPLGIIAIPAVAAVVGAWRGRDNAKKQLNNSDKFVDKKDLTVAPLLANRREALQKLQALVPAEFSLNPEEWLKTASPEEQKAFATLSKEFNQLDKKWNESQLENTDRKVLSSTDLIDKANLLRDKISNETDWEKKKLLMGQLIRRVDFNKDLADRGLINFGSKEERTAKSLDFYQALGSARLACYGFDYATAGLSYERKEKNFVKTGEDNGQDILEELEYVKVDIKNRAEALLNSLEKSGEQKLDSRRRDYIRDKMIQGALFGAAAGATGALLRDLTGHWVSDGIASGYRYVKEATGLQSEFGAVEKVVGGTFSAISHFKQNVSEQVGSVFHGDQTAVKEAIKTVAPVASIKEVLTDNTASTTTTEVLENTTPPTSSIKGTTVVESVAKASAKTVEATAATSFSDNINNEGLRSGQGDSVWRSTREIFKGHAQELGYTGDINDASAVDKWAEAQTGKTIANSGEFTNKVFEGNRVVLEQGANGYSIKVEAGTGAQPGFAAEPGVVNNAETVEAGTEAPGPADAKLPVEATLASPIKAEAIARELWADKMGAAYGLKPDEVVYSSPNVIKTQIGGHEIFINSADNSYFLFDEKGEEISGFLANEQGAAINNAHDFFASKFNLVEIAPVVSGNIANNESFINTSGNEDLAADQLMSQENFMKSGVLDRFNLSPRDFRNGTFKAFNVYINNGIREGLLYENAEYQIKFFPKTNQYEVHSLLKNGEIIEKGNISSSATAKVDLKNFVDDKLSAAAKLESTNVGGSSKVESNISGIGGNAQELKIAHDYEGLIKSGSLERFNVAAQDFEKEWVEYFRSEMGEGITVHADKYDFNFYPQDNSYEIIDNTNEKLGNMLKTGIISKDPSAKVDIYKFIVDQIQGLSAAN